MLPRTQQKPPAPGVHPRGAVLPLTALLLATLAAAPSPALAAGALRAPLVEARSIKLDGLPKEWPVPLGPLGSAVKGRVGKPDLEAKALVAYDEGRLYVAADVTDDALRAGADHLSLVLGFPGGAVQELELYPGEPGKSPGSVKLGGRPVAGAKLIEAPRSGGYTLEASVPWSALGGASSTRVGLRAGLFAHDADGSSTIEAVVGSAPGAEYASLPPLVTEPEQALEDGLLKSKGLRGAPAVDVVADVAGDALKERVLLHDRYLVVLGPGFRKGTQYYFAELIEAKDGTVPSVEARDLTGDGQAEIILRKRLGSGGKWREMMQVLQFGANDTPAPIFQHEVAISTDKGTVVNKVDFVPDGSKTAIRILPGTATGLDAESYAEPVETSYDPLLLPWGTVKSQLYKLTGGTFTKAGEERQAGAPPPRPKAAEPAARPAAKPPALSRAELMEQVYALYRKERGAKGRPSFDLGADVAEGREVERVLLHDRDLVVFGKGFKGGTGYSYLTLSQFASPEDIREVSARDLTGDGKAEIVVHGTIHANAPKEAGGETVDRDVVFVFQVAGGNLRRVFGAELRRSMGSKKIVGELRFVRAGDGLAIELAPGRAMAWTESTYPFNQDKGPVGGLEPLLLPWGGATAVRYTWNGTSFAR